MIYEEKEAGEVDRLYDTVLPFPSSPDKASTGK